MRVDVLEDTIAMDRSRGNCRTGIVYLFSAVVACVSGLVLVSHAM